MSDAGIAAAFTGVCEACEFPFGPGARIKPVTGGWVHTECWERDRG